MSDSPKAMTGTLGLRQRLDDLERAVRAHTDLRPRVGLVLGSGLGGVADALTDAAA